MSDNRTSLRPSFAQAPRSPMQVRGELRSALRAIDSAFAVLQRAADVFGRLREIWPDQCERLDLALRGYMAVLRRLVTLLDDARTLPDEVISIRYEVVIEAHHLLEIGSTAQQRLVLLKDACRVRPSQARQHLHTLIEKMNMLIEEGASLEQEIHALIDRSYFRGREVWLDAQ